MPSDNLLNELIGKPVWVFLRDDRGVRTGDVTCGIVIEKAEQDGSFIIMVGEPENKFLTVWMYNDIEEIEDWNEELEGEDRTMEESRERSGKCNRDRFE